MKAFRTRSQRFYRDRLPESDRILDSRLFKGKYKDLRNHMKTCTLGIVYGQSVHGLARDLQVPLWEASRLYGDFMALFPDLAKGIAATVGSSVVRGDAAAVSGLRRYRTGTGTPTRYERNWMTNHPIQASAAVVFKHAGNRLTGSTNGTARRSSYHSTTRSSSKRRWDVWAMWPSSRSA